MDANCCADRETSECCSTKAAATLAGLGSSDSSVKEPADTNTESSTKTPPVQKDTADIQCPKRRKRAVSIDLSSIFCDCCPQERPVKKQKRSFAEDLAALADFLKKERKVLKSTEVSKIEAFYEHSQKDTELVSEWKKSGSAVYSNMLEKLHRLQDMEEKFGKWEDHFA